MFKLIYACNDLCRVTGRREKGKKKKYARKTSKGLQGEKTNPFICSTMQFCEHKNTCISFVCLLLRAMNMARTQQLGRVSR